TATPATAGAPAMFVRNVCGFLGKAGFAAKARSLRKNAVRSVKSPERINAVAVGFGTVLSPFANCTITFLAASPGRGDLRTNAAHATGSPACCIQFASSRAVWMATAPATVFVTGGWFGSGNPSGKPSGPAVG